MLSKYMKPRAIRHDGRNITGTFEGGKLAPCMVVPFKESEIGTVSQSVILELDPIAGRMITEITAEIVSVLVPMQAIDVLKNPEENFVGSSESFRAKLLSGAAVFDVEPESEVSRRLGIVPRKVSNVKYVNEAVRIGHNVAVNYLRQRKYVKASQLETNNYQMTPALIGQTVLERFNAVLDPEDRINGALNLDLPDMQLPVDGIAISANGGTPPVDYVKETDGDVHQQPAAAAEWVGTDGNVFVKTYEPVATKWPAIYAKLEGLQTGKVSLSDFYAAEMQDKLTREMRKLVDENPEYGEEIVTRFAHGLSVDMGKQPIVVYEKSRVFGMGMTRGMDGPSLDVTQSNLATSLEFTVHVPPSEFGYMLYTFVSVKPDETVSSQPHPILSQEWGATNYVADELAIDPVPVAFRELDAEIDQAFEETPAFYIGNNHLLKNYQNYGFNRNLDPTTVENKTALWQLEIPLSVTPDSVIYPEQLNHYPFADQTAEVCTYTINSTAQINTPTIFGPTPVEELAIIETADVFEDLPET